MEDHRRLVAVCLLALCSAAVVVARPAQAQAPAPTTESALAREAAELVLHGHHAAAIALYQRKGALDQTPWPTDEAVPLVEALLGSARFDEARAVLRPQLTGKRPPVAVVLLAAELERLAGSATERVKLLTRALGQQAGQPQLVVATGAALLEVGKQPQARKLLDPLADRYEADEFTEPLDLLAVARSLELDGHVRDAHRVYQQAAEAASDDRERKAIERAWGLLLIDKHNWRDGDGSLAKVLAIDPHDPEALVGMARIDIGSDHDVARARKRLDDGLARAPRHPGLLAQRAEVALEDEDLGKARELLARALAVRKDFPPAVHAQGALCLLADDKPCWQEAEKAARGLNPNDGAFYLKAAEWLEQNHRYRELMPLLATAIERQPDLWTAHAQAGMGWARLVDDAKAKKALETANSGDPFDVRTANQLRVLYDDVLKQMVTLPGRSVDLRVHRKDRKALERTVLPFLQEAWQRLLPKYGFAPARPLQVEIFPTTEQFAVRTVGLPQLGAHAVCFGHLITSRSPVESAFNWKMVLQHELSHVFHIQASDGRVPRWLTEGLAMMESTWAEPRWSMHLERRAWERRTAGQLATIARFNVAFTQAKSMQDIVDAYFQAALLVEFLVDRSGFDKIAALVAAHKSGRATAELVQETYGAPAEQLDREFDTWLGKKYAHFERDFRPDLRALKQQPGPLAQALTDWQAGKREPALQVLRQLTAEAKLEPTQCPARFVLMRLASEGKDPAEATRQAQLLVQTPGCDGVLPRLLLADRAKTAGQPLELLTHLRTAHGLDRTESLVWKELLAAAGKAGQQLAVERKSGRAPTGAADWLGAVSPKRTGDEVRKLVRAVVELEPNAPQPPALLAKLAWADGQAGDASAVADLGLAARALEECEPAGRAAVWWEARWAVARGQPLAALVPYRLAAERSASAAERAEVWCELADVAAKAGRGDDASEAQRKCQAEGGKRTQPESPPTPAEPASPAVEPPAEPAAEPGTPT